MNFHLIEDDVFNHYFHVHASEGEIIRVGIHPVIFGFRVVGYYNGSVGPSLNWCAGADQEDVERLYSLMLAVLSHRAESHDCFNGLPTCSRIKPFYLDVDFLTEVVKAAGKSLRLIKLPSVIGLRGAFAELLSREYRDVPL